MINEKNNFLTVSWLSGLLSAEIFISTSEWGVQMPPLTAENSHLLRSGSQGTTLVMGQVTVDDTYRMVWNSECREQYSFISFLCSLCIWVHIWEPQCCYPSVPSGWHVGIRDLVVFINTSGVVLPSREYVFQLVSFKLIQPVFLNA